MFRAEEPHSDEASPMKTGLGFKKTVKEARRAFPKEQRAHQTSHIIPLP